MKTIKLATITLALLGFIVSAIAQGNNPGNVSVKQSGVVDKQTIENIRNLPPEQRAEAMRTLKDEYMRQHSERNTNVNSTSVTNNSAKPATANVKAAPAQKKLPLEPPHTEQNVPTALVQKPVVQQTLNVQNTTPPPTQAQKTEQIRLAHQRAKEQHKTTAAAKTPAPAQSTNTTSSGKPVESVQKPAQQVAPQIQNTSPELTMAQKAQLQRLADERNHKYNTAGSPSALRLNSSPAPVQKPLQQPVPVQQNGSRPGDANPKN